MADGGKESYPFATMQYDHLIAEVQHVWDHYNQPYHNAKRKEQLHRKLFHGTYECLKRWQEISDLESLIAIEGDDCPTEPIDAQKLREMLGE